jgi:hypothetical protein
VSVACTKPQPFRTAEGAWRWAFGLLQIRQDGGGAPTGLGHGSRPCEPDDVIKCLDRLYRARHITLDHARVLRVYAEKGTTPEPQSGDGRLWEEALKRLEWPLRVKGIVA